MGKSLALHRNNFVSRTYNAYGILATRQPEDPDVWALCDEKRWLQRRLNSAAAVIDRLLFRHHGSLFRPDFHDHHENLLGSL